MRALLLVRGRGWLSHGSWNCWRPRDAKLDLALRGQRLLELGGVVSLQHREALIQRPQLV
eukprot:5794821-Prymnesium_polylepis.1